MNLLNQVDAVIAEHKIPNWKIGVMAGANPDSTLQNKNVSFHRWRDKLAEGVVDLKVFGLLERACGLPEGEIMRRHHGGSAEVLPVKPSQFVPLLGSVSAAKSEWQADEVDGWLPYPFLKDARKRIFSVRVDGDCMAPTLQDGDLVFVDTQFDHDTLNNRIVVVRIGGEETTLKRFFQRDSGIELRPDNGKYPAIFVKPEEEPEVVGVVVKRVGGV